MSRALRITLDVTVVDAADDERVAEQVFDLVSQDPDDMVPAIETVDTFSHQHVA